MMRALLFLSLVFLGPVSSSLFGQTVAPSTDPGLLFYLSADHGFNADVAKGKPAPNFNSDVKILPNGSKGSYLQCGNEQLLSYWAPGNIYSQRGTVSFDWRSREPVDETEFPIFRVSYGDHSSWDMVWMRIDYNGHGFDAFVTDINLGRTRVSYTMPDFPKPNEWIHLTLSWDETVGIRFYVNGKMVAQKAPTGMFDATLDQFGPHSRLIAPTGVESSYNFMRGGDLDELRIYDRMLSDENVAALAHDEAPQNIPSLARSLDQQNWQGEWWLHYGWNRPGDIPTKLDTASTTVRKVEIHDVYDLKRWWWRATDGIRETTWPGVTNRSTLVGRHDYFQLPDWDTYALSGKSITFDMPDEKWNHVEISGGAYGDMALLQQDSETHLDKQGKLFDRAQGQEHTFNDVETPVDGGRLRFTNVVQETPIGELAAYYVHPGREPSGTAQLSYRLTAKAQPDNPTLAEEEDFINGRYPEDERMTMVALPAGAPLTPRPEPQTGLPIVHVLIPSDFREVVSDGRLPDGRLGHGFSYTWENMDGGLDGIAIDLPALKIKPTHGDYVPLNIQIRDPLWPMRNMFDFTFSVKPGEAHTLWLDTRDRILPNGKGLWLSIASASGEFDTRALEGAQIRLIFKPYSEALKEHVEDRLTQVRDNFANMVEENVTSKRLNTFVRFDRDVTDLLRVDPQNKLGRAYWHDVNKEQAKIPFTLPATPPGIPDWAFLQVTDLDWFKRLVDWYIDNRQISDGEFGGGLSDDSDLTNFWPAAAQLGVEPGKMADSLDHEMDAIYAQKMFTNGLATGQYDELHSYEDGLNVLGQEMLMHFGSPKQIERAMASSKRLEWITGVNEAGHRHVKTSYYSGAKQADGGVWGWSKPNSYYVFHPALSLVMFNGAPETRKMVVDIADGLLAHRHCTSAGKCTINGTIEFKTDKDQSGRYPWFIFWAAYRWTGDKKYLQPFEDDGAPSLQSITANALDLLNKRDTWGKQVVASVNASAVDRRPGAASPGEGAEHIAWQMTGDMNYLSKLYGSQIEASTDRWFINTEGSLWIDRIYGSATELQRARLGGVALTRGYIYPGNAVSWRFEGPATAESVAILIPNATDDHMKIMVYNLEPNAVTAHLVGGQIDPGKWEISQGTQTVEGGELKDKSTRTEAFERDGELALTLPPHATTVLEMKLVEKGTPYWSRPDVGIDPEDVSVSGRRMSVVVHSLGSVEAPVSEVVLRDAGGKVLASAKVPAIVAPLDLTPKTAKVSLALPAGDDWKAGSVSVEIKGVPEITKGNNTVEVKAAIR